MNKFYGPVGVGLALCMSTALLAQEPPARTGGTQSPTQAPTARDTNRNAEGDQVLVQWLLVDNENEIELSRLAITRANAPEVKQFAQKMIDDHTQFVQKLQQFAGRSGVGANTSDRAGMNRDLGGTGNTSGTGNTGTGNTGTGNTGTGNTGTGNTGTGNTGTGQVGQGNTGNTGTGNTGTGNTSGTGNTGSTGQVGQGNTGRDPKGEFPATGNRTGMPQDASATRTGSSFGTLDHERLIRELGRQCLESHTKLLNEKQGADFDRCYMNMALGAHVKAVDTLEVFRNHASPALRPTLDEGLRTVQMHLQHAKDLAKRTEQSLPAAGGK